MSQNSNAKYQVFVSSTYQDLRRERLAVLDQVLSHGHIPAGMEMFPAGDEDSWNVITQAIDGCDVYVVLVGARYGSCKKGEGISFTEREFEYARTHKKRILAFLLGESAEDYNKYREIEIDKNPEEANYTDRLEAFRNSVKEIREGEQRLVQFFEKADAEEQLELHENPRIQGLKARFATSFTTLIRSSANELSGWVRADADLIKIGKVHDDPFIRPVFDRLRDFADLRDRNVKNKEYKVAMAECFWWQFGKRISDSNISKIFFESGSTITHLSSKLKFDAISDETTSETLTVVSSEFRDRISASTNGILTYFDNLFFAKEYDFEIKLWPPGSPEGSYGATFGTEEFVHGKTMGASDWAYVERIRNDLDNLHLLLVTSSGLNLSNENSPLGLHVGSLKNKIFKIAILTSNTPKIYFMDQTKIDCDIDDIHCHFVSDYIDPKDGASANWVDLANSRPIAFCIGGERERLEQLKENFSAIGFTKSRIIPHHCGGAIVSMFVYNEKFEKFGMGEGLISKRSNS